MSPFVSPDLISSVAAANERRRERELAWLEAAADIIRDAHEELSADLDAYDARKARELSDYDLDCMARAKDMKEAQR